MGVRTTRVPMDTWLAPSSTARIRLARAVVPFNRPSGPWLCSVVVVTHRASVLTASEPPASSPAIRARPPAAAIAMRMGLSSAEPRPGAERQASAAVAGHRPDGRPFADPIADPGVDPVMADVAAPECGSR